MNSTVMVLGVGFLSTMLTTSGAAGSGGERHSNTI